MDTAFGLYECLDEGEERLGAEKAGRNDRSPEHGESSATSGVGMAVGAEESLASDGGFASIVRGAMKESVAEYVANAVAMDTPFSADSHPKVEEL